MFRVHLHGPNAKTAGYLLSVKEPRWTKSATASVAEGSALHDRARRRFIDAARRLRVEIQADPIDAERRRQHGVGFIGDAADFDAHGHNRSSWGLKPVTLFILTTMALLLFTVPFSRRS